MQEQKAAAARDKIGLQPLQLRRPVLDRCLYKREGERGRGPPIVSRWTSSKSWKIRGKLGRAWAISVNVSNVIFYGFSMSILYDRVNWFLTV